MSGFGIFQKINAKLDEGWKLTNASCPICNTSILGKHDSKDLYCVKCEMPVRFEPEEEEDEVEVINSGSGNGSAGKRNEVEEFENMLFSKENEARRKKADELSKKTGELLLKGWAMLEDTCVDCLFPYMRSKAGEVICVGCGPINKKKEETPKKPVVSETITSSPEIIRSQDSSKEYEAKRKRADELSRKTGELLLKGWAMLEDTCLDCLFPYMRSRAGEVICVGCGPVNKKKEEAPKKPVVSETKTSSPEVIPKEQAKPVFAAKEEKIEEAPRQKREKHPRAHRSHERSSNQETISTEVIEKFRFDESIDLYSKMTDILSKNLDDIEDQGLPSDLNKLREILEFQKQIDEAKTKVLFLHTKSKKH
jgi:uncharacterized Zn finger protein (UPF0148 family)